VTWHSSFIELPKGHKYFFGLEWDVDMKSIQLLVVAVFFAFSGQLISFSFKETEARELLIARMQEVPVKSPTSPPSPGLESIDIALALYSIRIPEFLDMHTFDPGLEDRGLTSGGTVSRAKSIAIGPPAFTSWGVLGSTLGHEIEVHANQSFFKVVLLDLFGAWRWKISGALQHFAKAFSLDIRMTTATLGTWYAEREAYEYELSQANRFGLSNEEKNNIKAVMNYYFPSKNSIDSLELEKENQNEIKTSAL
jgi:hypothetical protein